MVGGLDHFTSQPFIKSAEDTKCIRGHKMYKKVQGAD